MKKFASSIVLFLIGVLLCTPAMSETVTITENNYVALTTAVSQQSTSQVAQEIGMLSAKLRSSDTIYLILDTPGGSVMAGTQLADFINALPQKVKPICLFCASMGYHLFQSFDERLVQESSTLMSHRASLGGVSGQIPGEFITRVNQIMEYLGEMDARVAKRVGLSTEAYQQLIYNELWMSGNKAVEMKHADKVVTVKCDSELMKGYKTEEIPTPFGVFEVQFSKCPLISGIFGIKKVERKGFTQKYQVPKNQEELMSAIRKAKRNIQMEF